MSGSSITQLSATVNNALGKLYIYISYLGLDVNLSKSKVVVFGKQFSNIADICHNYSTLVIALEVKFLEVLFSHNLSWNNYIKHIKSKANKAYNILKSLAGVDGWV